MNYELIMKFGAVCLIYNLAFIQPFGQAIVKEALWVFPYCLLPICLFASLPIASLPIAYCLFAYCLLISTDNCM